MKTKILSKTLSVACALTALAMAGQAKAAFINGGIDFSSITGAEVSLPSGETLATATALIFPAGDNAQVDGATLDFGAELGEIGHFASFTFFAGAKPLWVLNDGNFSFDLSPGYAVLHPTANSLVVDGVGVVHGVGFDDTPGTFTLTTQSGKKKLEFSWSSSQDATPVPEPSTFIAGALLLLPFGAATLRLIRKRQTA